MYIKDIALALALPVLALSAAIPQDDPPVFTEDPSTDDADIVGGVAASAGDFPFIVSLQTSSGSHFCGGPLLNANTVLTAAHCTVDQTASSLRVRAGSLQRSSGGTLVSVSSLKVHPSYVSSSQDFDVAIWKLSTAVPTSTVSTYAQIAASGSDPVAGTTNTVAGWGTTTSGGSTLPAALRKVDVPVVSRTSCRSSYGTSAVTLNMYCAGLTAGGKDSCQGDSGGPIVDSSKTLLGVVSWGDGCALANAPGVYARVGSASLNSFITSNL